MAAVNIQIIAIMDKKDLKQIKEADFQKAVTVYAESHGWTVQFFRKTAAEGKDGRWKGLGPAGWPDLFMWRDGQAVAAELKTERGVATPEQKEKLRTLDLVDGIATHLWKPRDSATIMDILK